SHPAGGEHRNALPLIDGAGPLAKRDSFLLRTDPEVLAALRRWAEDELRSANAQLDFLLRRALREAGRLPAPERKHGGKGG
ncbi:MAG TPA: hypothetical protein VD788_06700, partial [Candidatus Polarisedimenticolaceae bacterium]|nr:hypothetical protein [Candidatus Polarisedimenticolaceae bacterium]